MITKYHRLHGLNNRNLFPHSSGGLEFKIKVSVGLGSLEGLSPWVVGGHLSVSSYSLSSVSVS